MTPDRRYKESHRLVLRVRAREEKARERAARPADVRARAKAWREANPGNHHALRIKKYGLTPIGFLALVHFQNYRCAICRRSFRTYGNQRFNIDHDHATGKVRGALCIGCNHAIGKLLDNPAVIMNAAGYVRRGGAL